MIPVNRTIRIHFLHLLTVWPRWHLIPILYLWRLALSMITESIKRLSRMPGQINTMLFSWKLPRRSISFTLISRKSSKGLTDRLSLSITAVTDFIIPERDARRFSGTQLSILCHKYLMMANMLLSISSLILTESRLPWVKILELMKIRLMIL